MPKQKKKKSLKGKNNGPQRQKTHHTGLDRATGSKPLPRQCTQPPRGETGVTGKRGHPKRQGEPRKSRICRNRLEGEGTTSCIKATDWRTVQAGGAPSKEPFLCIKNAQRLTRNIHGPLPVSHPGHISKPLKSSLKRGGKKRTFRGASKRNQCKTPLFE